MFKIKTLIAVLFSILMGILAVKALTTVKKNKGPARPKPVAVAPVKEEKPVPPPVDNLKIIPDGMRIATVMVDQVSGVTRMLKKGDRVDILAVTQTPAGTRGTMSRMVLQDIAVFSFDENAGDEHLIDKVGSTNRSRKEWAVHLLVTPAQGAVIATVDKLDSLRLLLRSKQDRQIPATRPQVFTPDTGVVEMAPNRTDPVVNIPMGMRAVTLDMTDSDGVCGSLRPGDRVDVIFSSKASRFSSQGQGVGAQGQIVDARKSARILIQDVAVLATQTSLKGVNDAAPADQVTLCVTPGQAEILAVASESSKTGTLKFIARNRHDRERTVTRGQMLDDILLKEKRPFKVIQVLRGIKSQEERFYGK